MEINSKWMKAGCMAAMLLLFAGCGDDDDNWAPGEAVEVIDQVYFISENPETEDLEVNTTASYTLTLTRGNNAEALALPLVSSGDTDLFDIPSTANFAAGENTTDITVTFKGSDTSGTYLCSIGIAEGSYNSPYTSLNTMIDIEQRICNWQVYVSDLAITDYYGDTFPSTYYVDLERDGELNSYRLKGFMSNYDLVFSLVEYEDGSGKYYIYPENGSSGTDDYGYEVWAFDAELGTTSYPLYHDLLDGSYLDYGCIYTGDDYGYTYINFSWRSGYIYGAFYQYDSDGNGVGWKYPYLYLSWTADDETELAKNAWGEE